MDAFWSSSLRLPVRRLQTCTTMPSFVQCWELNPGLLCLLSTLPTRLLLQSVLNILASLVMDLICAFFHFVFLRLSLCQPPECWDYKSVTPYSVEVLVFFHSFKMLPSHRQKICFCGAVGTGLAPASLSSSKFISYPPFLPTCTPLSVFVKTGFSMFPRLAWNSCCS